MLIAVVIHKDPDSDYGVTVPDLPGCYSAGYSIEDALAQTREAIELHLEGMFEDGGSLPDLSTIENLRRRKNYRDGTWAIVEIDLSKISGRAKRINITLPERLLDQIDKAASAERISRSGYLAKAAMERMSKHTD